MNKLGLVFAGGGGKGGYEIGVWKYLHSIGLDKYVEVISGTSVGALNSVLFCNGDLELAENIWIYQIKDKILDPHSIQKYLKMIMGCIGGLGGVFSLIQNIASDGFFSRAGLLEIIRKNIDLNKISLSPKRLYCTCCEFPNIKAEYFNLNNEALSQINQILLASSAIPVAFGKIQINGKEYYDGGLKDNIPVKPLNIEGCSHAIIVGLDYKAVSNPKWHNYIPNIIEVFPSEDLGNFFKGTLDFSPEGTRRRIELGKKDAAKLAGQFKYFLKAFQKEIENKQNSETEQFIDFKEPEKAIDNVICFKCKYKFRIENFDGKFLKIQKSTKKCPNCNEDILMRIAMK